MDADPHKLAVQWRADMGRPDRETLARTARERVLHRTGRDLIDVPDPLVLYDVIAGVCGCGDESPPGKAAWRELDEKVRMLLGWKCKRGVR